MKKTNFGNYLTALYFVYITFAFALLNFGINMSIESTFLMICGFIVVLISAAYGGYFLRAGLFKI